MKISTASSDLYKKNLSKEIILRTFEANFVGFWMGVWLGVVGWVWFFFLGGKNLFYGENNLYIE